MRAAVYTFALSSVSQNDAVSWNASTKDADYRLVVSCDLGREVCLYLRDCGVMIFQATANPPRSDDLLNTALALLPADVDVCVRLDLDETPKNGWRSALDLVWHPNLSALSTLLHNADGRRYYIQNVHSRFAVRWSGRYEEVLSVGDGLTAKTDTIIIHRRPRPAPDLRVLREAAEECLNAHRIFIYAEALLQQGFLEDGLTELRKYQSMGGLPEESAYLWRLAAQVDEQSAHSLLVEAQRIYNSPSNFLALAEHHFRSQDWGQAYLCCQYALGILRNKPQPVLPRTEDPRLRGPFLHDLAATAAWNMWDFEAAYGHAVEAVRRAPNDTVLQKHLKQIHDRIASGATLDPDMMEQSNIMETSPITVEVIRRGSTQSIKLEGDNKHDRAPEKHTT